MKKQSMQALIAFIFSLLAGCSIFGRELTRPTATANLSRQEAIEFALKNASHSRPEISGAQVTPVNVQARQMTLAEAVKRLDNDGQVAAGYDPKMTVWYVTMDGIWLDEFPRPADFPTPEPYRHFMIILDARSGLEIESSLKP
jgi:hypothetical protein